MTPPAVLELEGITPTSPELDVAGGDMITPALDVAISPGAVLLGEGPATIGGATPAYKL